ncbi:MAG: 4-hydroxy-tetrahydrodipicolinate synthase [Acidiferrobacteraceae bacterium]
MFDGSLVAIVTPMHEDGSLDWDALEKLVEFHVERGTRGIVAAATTGETSTLAVEEHCEVVRRIVRWSRHRVPVIAGSGANSTAEAIALTKEARAAGADACLLVTPYYNKPTQEGLFRHFRAIAEAVDIPQILYNVPGRTCCDLLPETVYRLSTVPRIVGIKEATGSVERARDIMRRCGKAFAVYSGDDATALDVLLAGGRGVISVTANVAPEKMQEMCRLALAGSEAMARRVNDLLMPLHRTLFIESNPIPVKWALQEMQLIGAGIRLPLTPLSGSCQAPVREALLAAGIAL